MMTRVCEELPGRGSMTGDTNANGLLDTTETWTFTNSGSLPLQGVTVTGDNGTPANPADDFLATFVGTWTFTAIHVATPGQYSNVGIATGTPPPGAGASVTDTDNHLGQTNPVINVVKLTNGTDKTSMHRFVPWKISRSADRRQIT
jgi:hypothetical protein